MIFISILLVAFMLLYPTAIWASWNERNGMDWIYSNTNYCPFKYKWQIANDLNSRDKSAKFSYLMTLPKGVVKSIWADYMVRQRSLI
jgi:hypothetical protein